MKLLMQLLVTTATAALVTLGVNTQLPTTTPNAPAVSPTTPHAATVTERVLNSGTLRCGTFDEAPFTTTDINTGKKTGIAVDVAETIATELGVKLEWVNISNFTTLTEDLKQGKYDAICASAFNLSRKGQIDYTTPYAYVPVYAYTTPEHTEFDGQLDKLDWTKVTIGGLDGEGATTIAQKKLPTAKFYSLPQLSNIGELLNSVISNKADMVFVIPTVFENFNASNPDKLKKIVADQPFHIFSVSFAVKPNEAGFKNLLDIIIRNMVVTGDMAALFKKHDPNNLLFQPVAPHNGR